MEHIENQNRYLIHKLHKVNGIQRQLHFRQTNTILNHINRINWDWIYWTEGDVEEKDDELSDSDTNTELDTESDTEYEVDMETYHNNRNKSYFYSKMIFYIFIVLLWIFMFQYVFDINVFDINVFDINIINMLMTKYNIYKYIDSLHLYADDLMFNV